VARRALPLHLHAALTGQVLVSAPKRVRRQRDYRQDGDQPDPLHVCVVHHDIRFPCRGARRIVLPPHPQGCRVSRSRCGHGLGCARDSSGEVESLAQRIANPRRPLLRPGCRHLPPQGGWPPCCRGVFPAAGLARATVGAGGGAGGDTIGSIPTGGKDLKGSGRCSEHHSPPSIGSRAPPVTHTPLHHRRPDQPHFRDGHWPESRR
jgi:hypothetical protein